MTLTRSARREGNEQPKPPTGRSRTNYAFGGRTATASTSRRKAGLERRGTCMLTVAVAALAGHAVKTG